MSAVNLKFTLALFTILTAGVLGTACSSDATGPSQDSGASVVPTDSLRVAYGYRVN